MGILGSIVEALVRAMFGAGHDIAFCGIIRSELVGNHHTWRTAVPFQKLSHHAFCSLGIAATLHQGVENKTILIDGPPQPVLFPWMVMTTSSTCHLPPSLPADRLLISLLKCLPNFSAKVSRSGETP
jgi:hypothetical protein